MAKRLVIFFTILSLCIALSGAYCTGAQATNYNVYDGNISNTYLQYFRDILPNISILDSYVLFRNSQYKYILVVGDILYENGTFASNTECTIYTISNETINNGAYQYNVSNIDSFTLTNNNNNIIYSNIGGFPHLEERGTNYEILITVLLFVFIISSIVRVIFYKCKR